MVRIIYFMNANISPNANISYSLFLKPPLK